MSHIDIKPLVTAGFAVKSLKTWRSSEGVGYQCTLVHHGKPVATVTEHGHGGPIDIAWTGLRYDGSIRDLASKSELKKAALAHVAHGEFTTVLEATPPFTLDDADARPLAVDEGLLMSTLVEFAELAKVCSKKTAFKLPEDEVGQYHTIAQPFGAEIKAYVLKKYPRAIFLNEEVAAVQA